MTRDEIFAELKALELSGSIEDMLYAYLPGEGALLDKVYLDDPSACGLENWIRKITELPDGS